MYLHEKTPRLFTIQTNFSQRSNVYILFFVFFYESCTEFLRINFPLLFCFALALFEEFSRKLFFTISSRELFHKEIKGQFLSHKSLWAHKNLTLDFFLDLKICRHLRIFANNIFTFTLSFSHKSHGEMKKKTLRFQLNFYFITIKRETRGIFFFTQLRLHSFKLLHKNTLTMTCIFLFLSSAPCQKQEKENTQRCIIKYSG